MRARRDRGVTLIATVLLSAIAATIALVVVRQTVLIARSETVRGDYDSAYRAALAVKEQFERELAADPQFIYKRLFAYERPRVCGEQTVIAPARPQDVDDTDPDAVHNTRWPAECPNTWTYLPAGDVSGDVGDPDEAGNFYDPAKHPVRVEIDPPTPTKPTLTARFLSLRGQTETGLTASYRPSSATAVTAYSESDLRLDSIYAAAGSAKIKVRGSLYSGGQIYLPTAEAEFDGAQLFAEHGFVGTLPESGHFYTSEDAGAETDGPGGTGGQPGDQAGENAGPRPRDIRETVPAPLSLSGLRSSYGRLETVACPAAEPAAAVVDDVAFTTSLCLRYGEPARDTADRLVTTSTTGTDAGARPAAYLLLFGGTEAAPTVNVYTAATAPATPGECVIRCDLTKLALSDFRANRHPASPPAPGDGGALWQQLGEFPFPVTGVVMTDADTYLGQCPGAIVAAEPCETTKTARSVTVVAGRPGDPRDIILAGPVGGVTASGSGTAGTGGGSAQLGLVATRSVVVPHYARRPGTDLDVRANIVAFGYGLRGTTSALRAFPAAQGPRGDNPDNYGAAFTLTGSIAAPRLEASLPGWSRVAVVTDPASVAAPPPYFPGFTTAWVSLGSDRLSSYDVCGRTSCAQVW